MTILKQLAIAIARDGTVGHDGNLAFSSKADLGAFASYTYRTVLVMGKNTAQELIDKAVYATADRPWVIISRGQHVLDKTEAYGNVYYAQDLDPALDLAEQLIERNPRLVGWTIIGGARTYEKVIEKINAVESVGLLNSAYILKINADIGGDSKLSLNADQFELAIRKTMVADYLFREVTAGFHGKLAGGVEARLPARAMHLLDSNELDAEGIEINGEMLSVTSGSGQFTCRVSDIVGFETETARNVLTLWFKGRNLNKEVRVAGDRPGLNYLATQLRRYI